MGNRIEVQEMALVTEKERRPKGLYHRLLAEREVKECHGIQTTGSPSPVESRILPGEETHMRINLSNYGSVQELYVDGILALASEAMEVSEALEAISALSGDVEFLSTDLIHEGAMQMFDDRFFAKEGGKPVEREQRTA